MYYNIKYKSKATEIANNLIQLLNRHYFFLKSDEKEGKLADKIGKLYYQEHPN